MVSLRVVDGLSGEGKAPTNAIADSTESTQTSMTSTTILTPSREDWEITSEDSLFVPS